MSGIKYSFTFMFEFGPPSKDKVTGDLQLVRDLEAQITERLGPPAFDKIDSSSYQDPETLIICVNQSLFPPVPRARLLAIYAPNDHEGGGANGCDIVIKPSFNEDSFRGFKSITPDMTVLPVHALPARTTPDAIAQAALSYSPPSRVSSYDCWDKIRRFWHGCDTPPDVITTFVIGDLGWNNWDSSKIIKDMTSLMKLRGGRALITTSHRTQEDDEKALVSALEPWLVHHYSWREAQLTREPNPYLAMLGAADEICVTGDSLSMVCDTLATNKPFRIAYDKKLIQRGEYPEDRLIKNLTKHGAKPLDKSPNITPPPAFDTGISSAIDTICTIARQKSMRLKPAP